MKHRNPTRAPHKIVANMAERAFRRPVTDADLRPLMAFYEKGRKADSFDSGVRDSVAAILAILHQDQTPACPTAISGARVPRVLGRLTPGSPQRWHRLLREMAAETPAVVSLRSAI